MRKITSLVICILMLVTLVLPAAAAETDVLTFKITADKKELAINDTVTLTVEVDHVPDGFKCSNFGVIVEYNTDEFSVVSVSSDKPYGGMQRGIKADPTDPEDNGMYAGKFPGVGGWNTQPVEDGEPEQTAVKPSGKVGTIVLRAGKKIDDVTKVISGSASVDGNTVDAEATVEIFEGLLGDVTGDGKVDGRDVTRLRRFLAGQDGVEINEANTVGIAAPYDKASGPDVTRLRRHLADRENVKLGK